MVEPAFDKNNITVVLTSSDYYTPYVGVVISSIIDNSVLENNYDILVLHTDISSNNQKLLSCMGSSTSNVSIRLIDISSIMDEYAFTYTNTNHSKYNFYRLCIPEVLSAYDKVVYLDSDVVILRDIADLYCIDLEGNILGACRDVRTAMHYYSGYDGTINTREYIDNDLKLHNPYDYFSSGVILYSLKAMRSNTTSKQLLEMCAARTWATVEQDVQNVLFEGKVKFLPYEWNVTIYSKVKKEYLTPTKIRNAYMDARINPSLIHYAGNNLPVNDPCVDMAIYFWKYAKNTPFYGVILERMETIQSQKKIKLSIFVSHRIDYNSMKILSPIYKHMLCGAVYYNGVSDKLGDNINENISNLRTSFCEMTVQYWAWKNHVADYYGLCHYRRYFSFAESKYVPDVSGMIKEPKVSQEIINKHYLTDDDYIVNYTSRYDAVIPIPSDVSLRSPSLPHPPPETVYEWWVKNPTYIEKSTLDITIQLVNELYPQYYPAMREYLQGTLYRGFNCYILRRELFHEMCSFQFGVLFELVKRIDMSQYEGTMIRTPGFVGEILYGVYIHWLTQQKQIRISEKPLVFFRDTLKNNEISTSKSPDTSAGLQGYADQEQKASEAEHRKIAGRLFVAIKNMLKKIAYNTSPAYRVALRNEKELEYLLQLSSQLQIQGHKVSTNTDRIMKAHKISSKPPILERDRWENRSLTSNDNLTSACLANEIHETHTASFSEYRYCHTGDDVVVLATGPSMAYYAPIPDVITIGVNKAFKNEGVNLDFYFLTDYEAYKEAPWLDELKNYSFVKFFGQYSVGEYRDRMQIPEKYVIENKARRFFQGAPSEDIHLNIEYYPLMAFYSISFQALQFALYTNAKRIFLVGCDCSSDGYFDGTSQISDGSVPVWKRGYNKIKLFAEHFYPDTEIISINPVGLKGVFRDVYTQEYINDHLEVDPHECELLDSVLIPESDR